GPTAADAEEGALPILGHDPSAPLGEVGIPAAPLDVDDQRKGADRVRRVAQVEGDLAAESVGGEVARERRAGDGRFLVRLVGLGAEGSGEAARRRAGKERGGNRERDGKGACDGEGAGGGKPHVGAASRCLPYRSSWRRA